MATVFGGTEMSLIAVDFMCEDNGCNHKISGYRGEEHLCEKCGKPMKEVPSVSGARWRLNDVQPMKL